MQYYFKRVFVLHSSEVIFSFLIKKSRQKAIEIEIAFFYFNYLDDFTRQRYGYNNIVFKTFQFSKVIVFSENDHSL